VNAGTITERDQREAQRVRTRRHADGVAASGERRELGLECVELRAEEIRA
jgi:hypothetical protein